MCLGMCVRYTYSSSAGLCWIVSHLIGTQFNVFLSSVVWTTQKRIIRIPVGRSLLVSLGIKVMSKSGHSSHKWRSVCVWSINMYSCSVPWDSGVKIFSFFWVFAETIGERTNKETMECFIVSNAGEFQIPNSNVFSLFAHAVFFGGSTNVWLFGLLDLRYLEPVFSYLIWQERRGVNTEITKWVFTLKVRRVEEVFASGEYNTFHSRTHTIPKNFCRVLNGAGSQSIVSVCQQTLAFFPEKYEMQDRAENEISTPKINYFLMKWHPIVCEWLHGLNDFWLIFLLKVCTPTTPHICFGLFFSDVFTFSQWSGSQFMQTSSTQK